MARPSNKIKLTSVSLKKAASLKEKIDRLTVELESILLGKSGALNGKKRGRPAKNSEPKASVVAKVDGRKKRRKLSPEAKARIAEGQRKRWAKVKEGK